MFTLTNVGFHQQQLVINRKLAADLVINSGEEKDSSENCLIMSCRTRNGNGYTTNSAAPEYEEMEKKKKKKNIREKAKEEEEEEKICHLI
jgi:hypothetical protein